MWQRVMIRVKERWFLGGALLIVAIVVLPLVLLQDATFLGADEQAGTLIETIRPDYKPWITPLWEPPSSEVASLLFAVQAALGAGVLGYGLAALKYQKPPAARPTPVPLVRQNP